MVETIVHDYKKYSYTFEFGAADASKSADIDADLGIKGEVIKLVATVPNWTNSVTAAIKMINSDTKEVFDSSSGVGAVPLAKNEEYNITLEKDECIILGISGEKWTVELSGVPGDSGGTFILTAYVRG